MNAIAEMSTDGQSANTYSFTPESLAAYVEHIIAARLAAVEAALDRLDEDNGTTWPRSAEGRFVRDTCTSTVRAALAAGPADTSR